MSNSSNRLSTEELFSQLAEGDTRALGLIYRRYYTRLKDYGIQLAGPGWEEEVHGIVQELFIWLAENYFKAGEISKPEAYLFRSVYRNLRLLQSNSRKKESVRDRFFRRTAPQEEGHFLSPEENFIHEEMESSSRSLLYEELQQLPPYLWETLYWRYYEGLSYKEIGCILSVGEQVARNYAYRAIKKLKKQLKQAGRLILVIWFLWYFLAV